VTVSGALFRDVIGSDTNRRGGDHGHPKLLMPSASLDPPSLPMSVIAPLR
jgi:hypothetical protein